MRINGEWYVGDEGIARPVIRGDIRGRDGSWQRTPFLVDTGADRTVFSAAMFALLGFPTITSHDPSAGLAAVLKPLRWRHKSDCFTIDRDTWCSEVSMLLLPLWKPSTSVC